MELVLFILSPVLESFMLIYPMRITIELPVCLSRTIQTFLLVPGSAVVVIVFGGVWVWIVIDQFGVISTLRIRTLQGVWLVAEGTGWIFLTSRRLGWSFMQG